MMMMMRVSHTHDVIGTLSICKALYFWCVCSFCYTCCVFLEYETSNQDQLWGLLSRRLGRSTSMVDADSVKSILQEELSKPSLASWIGGPVNIQIMRKYRDWKHHNDSFAPTTMDPRFICASCIVLFWASKRKAEINQIRKGDCDLTPRQITFSFSFGGKVGEGFGKFLMFP